MSSENAAVSAAERKRKRLEAWRKRQQAASPAPAVKISLSLGLNNNNKKKKNKTVAVPKITNPFGNEGDDDDDADEFTGRRRRRRLPDLDAAMIMEDSSKKTTSETTTTGRRRRRWDTTPTLQETTQADALDNFMDQLQQAGELAQQQKQQGDLILDNTNAKAATRDNLPSVSGGVITPEQLAQLNAKKRDDHEKDDETKTGKKENDGKSGDVETDDDEEEEEARRKFIEALKSAPAPTENGVGVPAATAEDPSVDRAPQLAAEVKSEKQRRELRLQELEREAEEARNSAEAAAAPEFGRLYNDMEGGVMEEAERNLDAAKATPDALVVLAELNKKKELKAVDHSKIEYMRFKKNLYIVPRSLANLTNDDVADRRAKLKIKVRGKGAPAPVSTFEECGLSERILKILAKQHIHEPFPVQAQCLPCIMAGRDVIGIAKTGSGKTLAYLLPMLRHILIQPPLASQESGPIGLILAPARELAYQIHSVCKVFVKSLGLKSTVVYGGAGVAEQIADLKRGAHIAVATPGRLIDILTMQSGKILSLQRVTYVVMDEADRMYDMGFAPQISAILDAVRPDRQTVLFSATFPKAVETLARKSLKYPIEVIVGGRSVASDSITQYAELVEEEEKFLRLLQLLGEQVEGTKKVIVFVDTQVRADNLFEQLLRSGYMTLSLHGGKEQEDRDSTISEFKRKDEPSVLVATGVAGRGLDVAACSCVINYSAPNHLEAYVHQVGRTGRAGNLGVAYTFVNSTDEAKYAPIVVRALSEAGQSENISTALKELSDSYKDKVERGEAKWAGSGFKGKGYSYDASEMNEAQKLAHLEKRQALIEAGLLDPDEEDPLLVDMSKNQSEKEGEADAVLSAISSGEQKKETDGNIVEIPAKLTPELLALPGMKDAILRAAGIVKETGDDPSMGRPVQTGPNHFVQEFEINDYPREARWKVTQKETTSRLQDEFQTAVTLKGEYFGPNRTPAEGERRLYLHLEATSERVLQNCVMEIQRLLNEETLRVGSRGLSGSSHKYNVLG